MASVEPAPASWQMAKLTAPERLRERTPRFAKPPPKPHKPKDRNKCCAFEDPWEDSSPQGRLVGERAQRARKSF